MTATSPHTGTTAVTTPFQPVMSIPNPLLQSLSLHENSLRAPGRAALRDAILKSGLNDAQQEAVNHIEGPMLVLAGAGTGKTRVVTNRIASLVAHGVPARRILAVTFTNKAADEMADRSRSLLGKHTNSRPTVLTLHGLGLRILRHHADVLGYKNSATIVSDVYRSNFLERAASKVLATHHFSKDPAQELEAQIGLWKSNLLGPQDILQTDHTLAPAYAEYQTRLRGAGVVDCDDLLRLPVGIFQHKELGEGILRMWQDRYDFILVDEYQDTNIAQFKLVSLLAARHRNIFVVGDDDQSIYGWRGANVGLIREFKSHWDGAKMVTLDVNYRSTQQILDCGNELMAHEPDRHQKALRAAKGNGSSPIAVAHNDEKAEAAWIAETIEKSEKPFGSFAVLVRDQYKMEPIALEFQKRKIPYELWKSDRIQMGEIKRNVYALIAAVQEPEVAEPAFIQLLDASIFAIRPTDFDSLLSLRDKGNLPMWEVLSKGDLSTLSSEARDQIGKLCSVIQRLHAKIAPTPIETLKRVTREIVCELYPESASPEAWTQKEPSEATEVLKTLVRYVNTYERKTPHATFKGFLGHIERIRRNLSRPERRRGNEEESPVIISTIHAVKGLEFPSVFFAGLTEGTIPSRQSLNSEDLTPLAEERRLFYVALTRAQEELSFSWPRIRKNGRSHGAVTPSRYLSESGADKFLVQGASLRKGGDAIQREMRLE